MKKIIIFMFVSLMLLVSCTSKIAIEHDSEYYKGKIYTDVRDMLSKNGFTNISEEVSDKKGIEKWLNKTPLSNLGIGKTGSVIEVIIDGKSVYKVNDGFDKNAKVVIRYKGE